MGATTQLNHSRALVDLMPVYLMQDTAEAACSPTFQGCRSTLPLVITTKKPKVWLSDPYKGQFPVPTSDDREPHDNPELHPVE